MSRIQNAADDEAMENEADRGMDDDQVVDNGLTNDLVESSPSQIKLEIKSALPRNLNFGARRAEGELDEPRPNYQRFMSDDSEEDDPIPGKKKELKLEKIQNFDDDE